MNAVSPSLRWGLTVLHAVLAAIFSWAGAVLPSGEAKVFVGACTVVAMGHVATSVTCVTGRLDWLRFAWRVSAWISLAFFAVGTTTLVVSGWYLATLFRTLGPAVGAAIACAWALVLLLTVPVSCWGLAATREREKDTRPRGRSGFWGVVIAVAGAVVVAAVAARGRAASATPRPVDIVDVERRIASALPSRAAPTATARTLAVPRGIVCATSPKHAEYTLLITHVDDERRHASVCLQSPSATDLGERLAAVFRESAFATPAVIDLVVATQTLDGSLAWLDPVKLRPGLDGICDGARCLAPWQLVARDRFMAHDLGFDADARMGVKASELRSDLDVPGNELAGMTRIETKSWWVHAERKLSTLSRMREVAAPLDAERVRTAADDARRHVLRALGADGQFRYLVQPFAPPSEDRAVHLVRQAGVAFTLCELGGSDPAVADAARKALTALGRYERKLGRGSALMVTSEVRNVRLTDVALPLAAALRCREHVGNEVDALVERLAAGVLGFQNATGGFDGSFDASSGRRDARKVLYAEGQAILALVLLEQARPHDAELRHAVQRAMDYVAHAYWNHPLRPFFFVEENWHCIAARVALTSHRHDGYERFCLDYVRFKSRFVLDEGAVDADVSGAFHWLSLSLPHTTATGGFGEALASAIAIERARGESADANLRTMFRVVAYLVHAQWSRASCFACQNPDDVVGGFSRHLASPVTRIDYVQHAWAAIVHGGRALGMFGGS